MNAMKDDAVQKDKLVREIYQHSDENFPILSWFMEPNKKRALMAIYGFLRIADNHADNFSTSIQEKLNRLNECEEQLRICYRHAAEKPLYVSLQKAIEVYELPIEPFLKLLQSFRNDVIKTRYQTLDDLLAQCQLSADPVGQLLLLVYQINDEEALPYSNAICTAFQLIDHWQDIRDDLRADRLFIPLNLLKQFQLKEEDLNNCHDGYVLDGLIGHLIALTENILDQGKPLMTMTKNWPFSFHCSLIWLSGKRLLKKMARNKTTILNTKTKLNKIDAIAILFKALIIQEPLHWLFKLNSTKLKSM
ncbi:squalene/phytoene synthase family protein [Legionella waltersii]|uniref:All-trans-phytoene synthase n=1 Tax=Legionella waltersii TaxID=66969 RepID=A0A0W0ZZT6_9GAMM|nr:squalene/phytoene synthase family protein [Legionella waltersii]KTD74629.1 All-trans-phytoene synthase [Legionella waltersii]SNV08888.1 squalene synthase HpnC [Legionella waltersii]